MKHQNVNRLAKRVKVQQAMRTCRGQEPESCRVRLSEAIEFMPPTLGEVARSAKQNEVERRSLNRRVSQSAPPTRRFGDRRSAGGTGVSPVRTETHGRDARATTAPIENSPDSGIARQPSTAALDCGTPAPRASGSRRAGALRSDRARCLAV